MCFQARLLRKANDLRLWKYANFFYGSITDFAHTPVTAQLRTPNTAECLEHFSEIFPALHARGGDIFRRHLVADPLGLGRENQRDHDRVPTRAAVDGFYAGIVPAAIVFSLWSFLLIRHKL